MTDKIFIGPFLLIKFFIAILTFSLSGSSSEFLNLNTISFKLMHTDKILITFNHSFKVWKFKIIDSSLNWVFEDAKRVYIKLYSFWDKIEDQLMLDSEILLKSISSNNGCHYRKLNTSFYFCIIFDIECLNIDQTTIFWALLFRLWIQPGNEYSLSVELLLLTLC